MSANSGVVSSVGEIGSRRVPILSSFESISNISLGALGQDRFLSSLDISDRVIKDASLLSSINRYLVGPIGHVSHEQES